MIATMTDTGLPAALDAERRPFRNTTMIYLETYVQDRLDTVLILHNAEAEALIWELARNLPAASRHILAEEMGRP